MAIESEKPLFVTFSIGIFRRLFLYRRRKVFRVKSSSNNKYDSRLTNRRSKTNETARILQAQVAWAVARIVHDTLFRITIIFKCRLYSYIELKNRM